MCGISAEFQARVAQPTSNLARRYSATAANMALILPIRLTANGSKIESTLPGGRIGPMTGTSQATAFVTAAAALIMARSDSGVPVTQVIDQILATGQSYTHLKDRSRSGVQLNLTRAATQSSSEKVFTGQRMRNQARIPALLFAAEPEAHPNTN